MSVRQVRTRYLWFTWGGKPGGLTVWLSIAGRKPLAHLPLWRRRLLHLPAVRWRLWPKPWNLNGPTGRPFRGIEAAVRDMTNQEPPA